MRAKTIIFILLILLSPSFAEARNLIKVDLREKNEKQQFFLGPTTPEKIELEIDVNRFTIPNPGLKRVESVTIELKRFKVGQDPQSLGEFEIEGAEFTNDKVTLTTEIPKLKEDITAANGFETGAYTYYVLAKDIVTNSTPSESDTITTDNSDSYTILIKTKTAVVPEINPVLALLAGLGILFILRKN